MIKHHPKFELIQAHVSGELPASLSAAISMHAEMCPTCQEQIAQLTSQVAELTFENENIENADLRFSEGEIGSVDFESMIASITESNDIIEQVKQADKTIVFSNKEYVLPKVLNNMPLDKTMSIGKLSRSRIQLDENEIHTSLLHINAGGSVPAHTHKGFEVTLLLDGSFKDEQGEYAKGDFIMLDGSHHHSPVSEEGCLCYTVANDALHFTQGINKLLNPIGSFIY